MSILALPRRIVAVFPALLLFACDAVDNDGADTGTEAARPVAAVEIAPRDLSRHVSVSAPVEPRMRIRVASRTDGTVEKVHFEEGDRVSAGEVLVELDMTEQRAELRRARAMREQARQDYQRMAELRERNVASPAEYQRSRAAVEVAESEVELWETRLDFGTLRASRDAVVTGRHIEPGEGVQARETLFTLAVMDALVLRPGLSEMDVVHLEPGQEVPVRLDAMPELVLEGKIRRIFPAAEQASRLITVEIALPDDAAARGVRPGYLGRARFTVDDRASVLAVPAAAVGEEGETRYVYVIKDGELRHRTVQPGVTRGQWTEIRSGLDAGDVVLATNPIDMSDGEQVRIVGWRG